MQKVSWKLNIFIWKNSLLLVFFQGTCINCSVNEGEKIESIPKGARCPFNFHTVDYQQWFKHITSLNWGQDYSLPWNLFMSSNCSRAVTLDNLLSNGCMTSQSNIQHYHLHSQNWCEDSFQSLIVYALEILWPFSVC